MDNTKMKKSFFDNFNTPLKIPAAFAAVTVFSALLSFAVSGGSMNIPQSLYNALSVITLNGSLLMGTEGMTAAGAVISGLTAQAGSLFFMLLGSWLILRGGSILELRIRGRNELFALIDKRCVSKLFRYILYYALICEAAGFVLYMPVFIPAFGFVRSLGYSLFTSVSAFTNCGVSVIPGSAAAMFSDNLLYEIVTSLMLFAGSAGPVFAACVLSNEKGVRIPFGMKQQMILFVCLSVLSAALIALFEMTGGSFAELPFYTGAGSALLASFGARGASLTGFDWAGLTHASRCVIVFLMFTGGLPGSVTGGIHTGVLAVVFIWLVRYPCDGDDVRIKDCGLDRKLVSNAVYVLVAALACCLVLTILFAASGMAMSDALFEAVSSFTLSGIHSVQVPGGALYVTASVISMISGRALPLYIIYLLTGRKSSSGGIRKNITGSDMVI